MERRRLERCDLVWGNVVWCDMVSGYLARYFLDGCDVVWGDVVRPHLGLGLPRDEWLREGCESKGPAPLEAVQVEPATADEQ